MSTKPLSTGNAFTLGYGDRPHGFVPGVKAKPSKPVAKNRRKPTGGFVAKNGTLGGLGGAKLKTPKVQPGAIKVKGRK